MSGYILPKAWRITFSVEILICLATVIFWAVLPGDYLRDVYRLEGTGAYFLLQQTANVVFCVYVYLYFRMLTAKPFDLRSFRWLQEAMAIGDGVIIGVSVPHAILLQPDPVLLAAQAGMASLWLIIRLVFLWQSRRP